MSNREYAEKTKAFREACSEAQIEPTIRQASKWRNGKGKAFAWLKAQTGEARETK